MINSHSWFVQKKNEPELLIFWHSVWKLLSYRKEAGNWQFKRTRSSHRNHIRSSASLIYGECRHRRSYRWKISSTAIKKIKAIWWINWNSMNKFGSKEFEGNLLIINKLIIKLKLHTSRCKCFIQGLFS